MQVTLCLIKKVFLLKALWKVEQVLSCLQHRLIDLVKRGWQKFLSFLAQYGSILVQFVYKYVYTGQ